MIVVVNDLHGSTAEHITRSNKHRESNLVANLASLFEGDSGSTWRLRNSELVTKSVPDFSVLSSID
jgi:hypothetical protein